MFGYALQLVFLIHSNHTLLFNIQVFPLNLKICFFFFLMVIPLALTSGNVDQFLFYTLKTYFIYFNTNTVGCKNPPVANFPPKTLKPCSIWVCKAKKFSILATIRLHICNHTVHGVINKNIIF